MGQSHSVVLVEWEPIPQAERNGIIIRYEVWFQDQPHTPQVREALAESLTLTGLNESEVYTIMVRGVTSAGDGPYSSPVSVMTQEFSKCACVLCMMDTCSCFVVLIFSFQR